MKVLIVTDIFLAPGSNPWLLDDLAAEFARQGHDVDVLVHSPTTARPRGQSKLDNGVTTFSVGATHPHKGALPKLLSYLLTGLRLHTTGWRWARRAPYDLCVYHSIATFSFGLPSRLKRRHGVGTSLFVMWDFFPIHQVEIGRIRSGFALKVLKWLEKVAIQNADVIAVMSDANQEFLHKYHPGLHARNVIIPPWASNTNSDLIPKRDRFTVIFGGQLAKGRGLDTLIEAAALLQDADTEVDILVAGTGPDEEKLRANVAKLSLHNVQFLGQLDRSEYRSVLRSCHVGLAITVPGVSPPSFPSKIVEYCANGIPIIVSVEASSDAGTFVENHGAGIAIPAGDSSELAKSVQKLALEHEEGTLVQRAERAQALFDDELSVRNSVLRMVDQVGIRSNSAGADQV